MNEYKIGSLVKISGAFVDEDSQADIDPATVKVNVRSPGGTVTTKIYGTDSEVIQDSVGNYHMDVDANESGEWTYYWYSTGTGQAAEDKQFLVTATKAA